MIGSPYQSCRNDERIGTATPNPAAKTRENFFIHRSTTRPANEIAATVEGISIDELTFASPSERS
jgi:hypothetical protein